MFTPENEHALHDIIKHQTPEILEVVIDTVKSRLQEEGGREFAQAKMKQLLDGGGACGRTPLWIACYCNNEEVVAIFAREGANPWLADKLAKKTPLMMACVMGHAGCVKNLLDNMHQQFWVSPENGITRYIDARSVTGFPALTYAVAWNHTCVVEVLLQYGPSLTIQNPTQSFKSALVVPPGSTPLHVAAITSNLDIAMMLLRSHAECITRMPDIRLFRNTNGHQPWQMARNMLGSTSVLDAPQILHPTIPYESFFPPGTLNPQGVPSLSCLAANALRLHQALMHANSSSMEALQVLDNNQPPYPASMARSSELGGSSWGGSAWGGSSPVDLQGTSGGASPRWQGLGDGGGALFSIRPEDLPPGTLGINFTRPTIGEEREEEEDIVQDVASPRLPGSNRHKRSSTATGNSGDSGQNSVGQPGLTSSVSREVADVLRVCVCVCVCVPPVRSPQGQHRARAPSESGSVTLRGMPSMERRQGGPSSVALPGGGPRCARVSTFGRSSQVSASASASQSLRGGSPERGTSSDQRSTRSGGDFPPSESNESLCGICFDHNCLLRIQGCKHAMCDECAQQLLGTMVNAPLPCPFCRGLGSDEEIRSLRNALKCCGWSRTSLLFGMGIASCSGYGKKKSKQDVLKDQMWVFLAVHNALLFLLRGQNSRRNALGQGRMGAQDGKMDWCKRQER
ncbi:hypothetical protein DUNSADRAFT_9994 [Dunaliella salina]|uniref:RING-type domain-containing protein n=1 Tax=Dunaliella salina TaxID=3046 RepID=A0ABQ7GGD9_DUNSA|nr:hypothetical protein DUNSADRAFT_9994 [Dunaliella salina]|eukprot:KAF5833651.1 hypothetical protein DUNSADRAFT_9994 [Dunaliella salina]